MEAQEMWNKFKSSIARNLFFVIIAVASIGYILYGCIGIQPTGKTVSEIILDGTMLFLFATFIVKMFDCDALRRGERGERLKREYEKHDKVLEKIAPYSKYLDSWCACKNEQALKSVKTYLLQRESISYEDYIKGNIDYANLTKNKKRAIRKANTARVTELTASGLTCGSSKQKDPNYMGRSKQQYQKNKDLTGVAGRIIGGLIAGYYSVGLVGDMTLATFLWTSIQVVLILLMGSLQWALSTAYMNDEYPNRIAEQTRRLNEFALDFESGALKEIIENNKEEKVYEQSRQYVAKTDETIEWKENVQSTECASANSGSQNDNATITSGKNNANTSSEASGASAEFVTSDSAISANNATDSAISSASQSTSVQ